MILNSEEIKHDQGTGEDWKKNFPEYLNKKEAAAYICSTVKKIALFRKEGMLKFSKLWNEYIYKKYRLDDFMEQWAGYDLSNPEKIRAAVRLKEWKKRHGN
ncbi:MAG: hypothetical protein IJJ29_12390 [Solobacterium sp.]|nr:hypothetical protein [Solobacterium sp.]